MRIGNTDDAVDLLFILKELDRKGAIYLLSHEVETRHLQDKLYEIKLREHRLYYMYWPGNRVVLLHACCKQKNSTEKKDLDIGLKRMREILLRETE